MYCVRPIPDFPTYYADITGRIFSFGLHRNYSKEKTFRKLSGHINVQGYRVVGIMQKGERVSPKKVHRLVLAAFRGESSLLTRHLDGDKLNNRLENLAWGTEHENSQDRILHGTSGRGEKHFKAKLTAENVLDIRRMYAEGSPILAMADKYKVSRGCITNIIYRHNWKHI